MSLKRTQICTIKEVTVLVLTAPNHKYFCYREHTELTVSSTQSNARWCSKSWPFGPKELGFLRLLLLLLLKEI